MGHLGYVTEPLPTFKVFISSGEYLVCKDVCHQVGIAIQNTTVIEDLFVLPMDGANIVLDIQWLAKLGPVMIDHKKLTMEFFVGENWIRLQGDPLLLEVEISKSGLQKLKAKEM